MIKIRYCVQYNSRFRHLKEIDEIILPYKGIANDEYIVDFINNNFQQKQRIIISMTMLVDEELSRLAEDAIPAFNVLKEQGWNIAVLVDFKKDILTLLQKNEVPFILRTFPKNIEEVYIQAALGASDIYITESLGFYLKDLQKIKDKYKVKYRVFPNIAQSGKGGFLGLPPEKKFWIRPEDTEIYEGYIDVFEILGGQDNSRLSVVYEIYKQEQWLGDLKSIILDFGENSVPNTGMNPHFAEMRLNCKKNCLTGTNCNLCSQMVQLAESFNQVGIEVIKPRKKPEYTEEEKENILKRLNTNGSSSNEESMPVH